MCREAWVEYTSRVYGRPTAPGPCARRAVGGAPRVAGLATATLGLCCPGMLPWAEAIDSLAERSGFAGVVLVDRGGENKFGKAYGLAHRAQQVPNTVDTRFAIASGTKGLTALAVVSLISDGALGLATARGRCWAGICRSSAMT
jgi:CubicO group peptidase (beta-lactamase class C family)